MSLPPNTSLIRTTAEYVFLTFYATNRHDFQKCSTLYGRPFYFSLRTKSHQIGNYSQSSVRSHGVGSVWHVNITCHRLSFRRNRVKTQRAINNTNFHCFKCHTILCKVVPAIQMRKVKVHLYTYILFAWQSMTPKGKHSVYTGNDVWTMIKRLWYDWRYIVLNPLSVKKI